MKATTVATTLCGTFLVASLAYAQDPSRSLSELQDEIRMGADTLAQSTPTTTDESADYALYRMREESNRPFLALSIMGMGIFSLFLVLMHLKHREAPADLIVNGSGLVLVIFATILVVILAKVDQQLTAATGILGAIAGYLFGKTTKGAEAEQKPDKVTA